MDGAGNRNVRAPALAVRDRSFWRAERVRVPGEADHSRLLDQRRLLCLRKDRLRGVGRQEPGEPMCCRRWRTPVIL